VNRRYAALIVAAVLVAVEVVHGVATIAAANRASSSVGRRSRCRQSVQSADATGMKSLYRCLLVALCVTPRLSRERVDVGDRVCEGSSMFGRRKVLLPPFHSWAELSLDF
jgi:hypothetical protein